LHAIRHKTILPERQRLVYKVICHVLKATSHSGLILAQVISLVIVTAWNINSYRLSRYSFRFNFH